MRPNLVKLATECDDNDDSIGDILKANDHCERIINQYRTIFDKDSSSFMKFSDDVNLVNISTSHGSHDEHASGPKSRLPHEDLIGGFAPGTAPQGNASRGAYDALKELQDLFLTDHSSGNPNDAKRTFSFESTKTNIFDSNNSSLEHLSKSTSNSNSLAATLIPTSMSNQKMSASFDESSKWITKI